MISSEIMRLRPLSDAVISPDYLALYFCSLVGFALVEKFVHGVSNFGISQGDIKKLHIYLPCQKNGTVDLAWQERLAAKVESAAAAKTRARAKLEEAKRLVEEALKHNSTCAKYQGDLTYFETLNARLSEIGKSWRPD